MENLKKVETDLQLWFLKIKIVFQSSFLLFEKMSGRNILFDMKLSFSVICW